MSEYHRAAGCIDRTKDDRPGGESRQTVAKQQIEGFSSAWRCVQARYHEVSHTERGLLEGIGDTQPQRINNWKGPYLKRSLSPKDPWGNNYVYTYPGEHGDYDMVSYGADGNSGGDGEDKDVRSWN